MNSPIIEYEAGKQITLEQIKHLVEWSQKLIKYLIKMERDDQEFDFSICEEKILLMMEYLQIFGETKEI